MEKKRKLKLLRKRNRKESRSSAFLLLSSSCIGSAPVPWLGHAW